ncbi:hypothetical protein M407DRAFT_28574 [Tulasnella calospora MUT 4182]|uniref:Protein YIP n=1 Tax=Tulasnella calospora MUT 4182 TaxID=1051891 RepID=A0A0C3KKE5_9AGAM|nr:hypothetical protein M407DRAFT_28574 [Tulasnella calospora MUT 4182]
MADDYHPAQLHPQEPSASGFWTVEYYQQYFDVDTKTVLMRCYAALVPTNDFVADVCDSKPDMYGPFWTLTTVIFFLFVTTSLASSIGSYLSDKPYNYDFTLLSVAVGLVYAYGMGLPAAMWALMRYLSVTEWGLVEWLAVWGYGMTVWIPVSLLCIAPIPLLRWVLVGLAAILSGYFLVRNVYPVLALAEQKSTRLLVPIIAVIHLGVALTLKILFFSYYIVKEVGVKEPDALPSSPVGPDSPAPTALFS